MPCSCATRARVPSSLEPPRRPVRRALATDKLDARCVPACPPPAREAFVRRRVTSHARIRRLRTRCGLEAGILTRRCIGRVLARSGVLFGGSVVGCGRHAARAAASPTSPVGRCDLHSAAMRLTRASHADTGCSTGVRYPAAVLADAPQHWWRLLDDGGGAADCAGTASALGGTFSYYPPVLRSGGVQPGTTDTAAPYAMRFLGAAPYQSYTCGFRNGAVSGPTLNFVEMLPANTTDMSAFGTAASWSLEYWYLATPGSMVSNCPYPILNAESEQGPRIALAVSRTANSAPFYPSMRMVYAAGTSCTLDTATAAGPAAVGSLSVSTFSHRRVHRCDRRRQRHVSPARRLRQRPGAVDRMVQRHWRRRAERRHVLESCAPGQPGSVLQL